MNGDEIFFGDAPFVPGEFFAPGELEEEEAKVARRLLFLYDSILRELETERWADASKRAAPLLERLWIDRRDEKDFMLVGRLAMKKTRAQIAEELELNAADVAARVAALRGKYNPEFQDILGPTRQRGR